MNEFDVGPAKIERFPEGGHSSAVHLPGEHDGTPNIVSLSDRPELQPACDSLVAASMPRSEERRVGKGVD